MPVSAEHSIDGNASRSAAPFAEQSESVLRELREAFAAMVRALPGQPKRPSEIHRAMEIDRKLAWKLAKLVGDDDPFTAAQHVPGPQATLLVFEAARQCNVSEVILDRVSAAVERFEQLARVHAGDRESLLMMISSFASRGRRQADIAHRRSAFKANSYLWGVQAQTDVNLLFVNICPDDPARIDMVSLRGFVGLRRFRANVPWLIARCRVTDNDGDVRDRPKRRPLDPSIKPGETPILREHCSEPPPQIRRVEGHNGSYEDELIEGEVGDTAAITCLIAEAFSNASSRYHDEHNTLGRLIASARTPSEAMVLDLVVHEDLFGPLHPRLRVYSDLEGPSLCGIECGTRDELPCRESVEYMGKGAAVMHSAEVPYHADIGRTVFRLMDWPGERFDVYRAVIPFPMIPTSAALSHELPVRPQ